MDSGEASVQEKMSANQKSLITILLIEDNPGDARLISEYLKSEDHLKFELKWAASFTELDKAHNPDLLDLNLPESNGIETFDHVHSIYPDTPIIVQTGLNDTEIGNLTVSKGAQDFLIKGNFSGALLIKSINYALERNRLLLNIKYEQHLHEREKLLAEIFENTSVAIYRTNTDAEFLVANNAIIKMLGYSSREEFNDLKLSSFFPDIDQWVKFCNLLSEEKIIKNFEQKLIRKDGSVIKTLHSSRVVVDENGNSFFEGSIDDITKIKEAEELLSEMLNEKEVLLKELHHRSKNNMQIISSLISLKASLMNNDELNIVLNDISSRISAIALIHQKLYQSKNLSHISLKEYITDLSQLLMTSHNNNRGYITLHLDLEEIPVKIDSAIQFGLIINELVTNSLKYAFPENKNGRIKISLYNTEDKVVLNFSDNGVGIPDTKNLTESETLGIQLIKAISEDQLMGEAVFNTSNGFSCTVTSSIIKS